MTKKQKPTRHYESVEYQHDGKIYAGQFYLEDGWLYASCECGSQDAALHSSNPQILARILIREIIERARHEG